MVAYAVAEASYSLWVNAGIDQSLAYGLKLLAFCLISILVAPRLYRRYYNGREIWPIAAVTRHRWLLVTGGALVLLIPFEFTNHFRLLEKL